jgi:EmrB/QacA subfamily drug resistance transporter
VSRHGALAVASFGALLAFLDVTIVNIAFPSIEQSFPKTSVSQLSWVLNAYNIVFAALLVAAGRLADVFGRRRTFAAGLLLFTASSLACAVAPSVGVLVGARVVQAVGAGFIVPASLAIVIEAFPAERRAHALGLWGATAALASGLGPPLGGALVQLDSWRLAFVINVPLGLVAWVATRRVLVESRAPGRRQLPDLKGAALLAVGIALLTLGVVEGPTWGWTSGGVIGSFVGAIVLTASLARSTRRHPVPVIDPTLLRIPAFAVANVATLLAGIGFYAYMLNNILWLHYVWGWSFLGCGLAVAPGAVVAAVVAGGLGELADKRGHRLIALPGAVVWVLAYVWYFTKVGARPDFLGAWLPGQLLSGIGVGATLPIVSSAAVSAVPGGRYATASAVVSSARQLGAVIGVAILVVIIGNPTAASAATVFQRGWLLSIGAFAATAVALLWLRKPTHEAVETAEPLRPPSVSVNPTRRPSREGRASFARSTLFAGLPEGARDALLDGAGRITCGGGESLFDVGDSADALYLVESGRLEVVIDGVVVREIGPGDVVGELGVLTGASRSAGVRARRDSVLTCVTPAAFDRVLARDPAAARALATVLAEQLQTNRPASEPEEPPPGVIAVIGDALGAGALTSVVEALVGALSLSATVLVSHDIEPAALQRAEAEHEHVVLVSDGADDEWRAFCRRQADRVVVAAPSDCLPSEAGAASYVVLLGPAPSGDRLRSWYDACAPRFVYAAPADSLSDVAEVVAARLTRRSIGVVIGGVGARSLAAIGVLEELVRAGYRIDRLAGSDVGAFIAALFATGRDPDAVDAACYEEFVRRSPFSDYRLPTVALSRGRNIEAAVQRQFAGVLFEELPRQLCVVSTDLIRGKLVTHRRGPVAPAVRASLALPGLYPPVRSDGALLIAGAVLDSLPTAALATPDEGPIVAVDATPLRQTGDDDPARAPGLGETLLRAVLMTGKAEVDRGARHASVVVTPDPAGVGLLEFHQIDRAREAGRLAGEAAARALADLVRAR